MVFFKIYFYFAAFLIFELNYSRGKARPEALTISISLALTLFSAFFKILHLSHIVLMCPWAKKYASIIWTFWTASVIRIVSLVSCNFTGLMQYNLRVTSVDSSVAFLLSSNMRYLEALTNFQVALVLGCQFNPSLSHIIPPACWPVNSLYLEISITVFQKTDK